MTEVIKGEGGASLEHDVWGPWIDISWHDDLGWEVTGMPEFGTAFVRFNPKRKEVREFAKHLLKLTEKR